jgi:transcriptional regulator with XRE-family HTH domain
MNVTAEQKTIARTKLAQLIRRARQIERLQFKLDDERDARNREIFELSSVDGITQSQLAEAADVGETYVRNIIRGKGDPIAGAKI